MEKIKYAEYNPSMGKLIDIEDPITYLKNHQKYSSNIPYERLLYNHQELLNKEDHYYIICRKGVKSRKAVNILEFYGYNVTQVINE